MLVSTTEGITERIKWNKGVNHENASKVWWRLERCAIFCMQQSFVKSKMISKKYSKYFLSLDKSKHYGIKFLMTVVVKYNLIKKNNYGIKYSVIMVCMQNHLGTKNWQIDSILSTCVIGQNVDNLWFRKHEICNVFFLEGNTYFTNCKENNEIKQKI